MDKTHLQGLKNLRKIIFNALRSEFRRKSHFWKTKSQNLPSNTEIFDIFEILKFIWWPMAGGLNFFVTQKIFDRQTQKFIILI